MELVEVFGYLALFFGMFAYFFKDDFKFKLNQLICTMFFGFHFYLMESWAGAISVAIGFVSLLLSMTLKNKMINYFFFAVYVGLFIYGVVNFEQEKWFEIVPYISNIFWAIAMLFMTGQKTNIGLLFVVGFWIIYAIAVNSFPNFATQICVLVMLLYRMSLLSKNKEKIILEN